MKKGRKLLIPVILAAVAAYNMYVYTDGSSVLKSTNLRESDSVTVNYSKGIFHPFNSTELSTQQTAEISKMLEGYKLKKLRTDGYIHPDSTESCHIIARDSLVKSSAVITVTGGDHLGIHYGGDNSLYYKILNPESADIYSHISRLIRANNAEKARLYNFEVTTEFPGSWQFVKRENRSEQWETPYPLMNLQEIYDIYDAEGNHIGAGGRAKYDADAQSLWRIYNFIALPNMYNFSVPPSDDSTEADSFYRTAHTYDKGECATTKVYHSPSLQYHYHPEDYDGTDIPETGAVYNSGILCYNSEKNMFIAMEFSPEYVDDRMLRRLAASTEIK